MPREITNLIPSHVSIVDKAANKRSFLLTKSEKAPNVTTQVEYIVKKDESQQIVYGIVYEPDVEDAHGDFMTAAEIEKAAHIFMKEYQNIDKQHDFESEVGKVIESYIAPADFEIGGQQVTKGSWVMAVKVEDEMWGLIQKGEFTGFSLAGMAELIERAAPAPIEDEEKGLLHLMKSLIRRVSKGEIKDDIENARPLNDVNTAAWRFSDVVDSERWSWKPDISRIKAAYDDLGEYVNALGEGVTKSQGEEVTDMTQEQIEKLLAENNANLLKSMQDLLKGEDDSKEQESGADDKDADQGDEVKQTELEKAQAAEIEELKKQLSVRPLPASHEEVTKAEVPDKASYASHFG